MDGNGKQAGCGKQVENKWNAFSTNGLGMKISCSKISMQDLENKGTETLSTQILRSYGFLRESETYLVPLKHL